MNKSEIYVILRDEKPIYVGSTWRGFERRFREHIAGKKFLISDSIKVLEVAVNDCRFIAEKKWLRHFLAKGFEMLNRTDPEWYPGKQEGSGFSDLHRQRISISLKGRKLSAKHRRSMSIGMSKSRKLKPSPGMTGKSHSEETKRKIRESNKGKHQKHRGRKLTDEHKKNASESKKRFYAEVWRISKEFEPELKFSEALEIYRNRKFNSVS